MAVKKASTLNLVDMLNKIRDLDKSQVASQLQIASTLVAIRDHEFYLESGYNSFNDMVHYELDFAISTAGRYCSLYNSYTRHRYPKLKFQKLMQQFGWHRLEAALRGATKQLGERAIKGRLLEMDKGRNQYNFNMPTQADAARIDALLGRFGLEHDKAGRRHNLSESLMALLDDYEARVARESSLTRQGAPRKKHRARLEAVH